MRLVHPTLSDLQLRSAVSRFKMSDVAPAIVAADLQTSKAADVVLTPNTCVVIPFTTFIENSGSFAFASSGDGTFTMPNNGTYQITLTARLLNSADTKSGPVQFVAFMAYSGISIVNTPVVFSVQPGNSTCVASFTVMGYQAGTEISACLQTESSILSLTTPIDSDNAPADLSIRLV